MPGPPEGQPGGRRLACGSAKGPTGPNWELAATLTRGRSWSRQRRNCYGGAGQAYYGDDYPLRRGGQGRLSSSQEAGQCPARFRERRLGGIRHHRRVSDSQQRRETPAVCRGERGHRRQGSGYCWNRQLQHRGERRAEHGSPEAGSGRPALGGALLQQAAPRRASISTSRPSPRILTCPAWCTTSPAAPASI